MLKSWHIENFKAIVDSGDLKLAPVTVFAGLNSSGKSSLLQSILMISQTLSNRLADRPLIPNGPIVQLGTFRDILNEDASSPVLTINFTVTLATRNVEDEVECKLNFTGLNLHQPSFSAIEASKVELKDVSLNLLGRFKDDKRFSIHTKFRARKFTQDEFKVFLERISPEYYHLIPYPLEQSNYRGETLQSWLDNGHRNQDDENENGLVRFFHFLPDSLISEYDKKLEYVGIGSESWLLGGSVENLTTFFSSQIRYLGPLRADPNAVQGFAPTSEIDDVGSKGQYAAAVYDANRNARIDWYNPNTQQVEQATLKEALDIWAQYLGVAKQIKTDEAGQSGFSWRVVHKEGHRALPLSAVGVGVSQILPILVMGLLSPKDTLLIVEQPELHLHPRVQARLGDFFVGLSKCNKQCLTETHSENLVNQLRLHIVEAGGQDKSDCQIYFVDQDETGAAKFEPIEISANGNILNWPKGFFDETMLQEDKITAASIKQRASLYRNGKNGKHD